LVIKVIQVNLRNLVSSSSNNNSLLCLALVLITPDTRIDLNNIRPRPLLTVQAMRSSEMAVASFTHPFS
jgi:hypothetical protein